MLSITFIIEEILHWPEHMIKVLLDFLTKSSYSTVLEKSPIYFCFYPQKNNKPTLFGYDTVCGKTPSQNVKRYKISISTKTLLCLVRYGSAFFYDKMEKFFHI